MHIAGPQLISLSCVAAKPAGSCDWHSHPFHEFTLCTDDGATVGHAGTLVAAQPNMLFLWLPGERHRYVTSANQRPRFWVVHFSCPKQFIRPLPAAFDRSPDRRLWALGPAHAESFRWVFLRLISEQFPADPLTDRVRALYLQLLLVNVERWATQGDSAPVLAPVTDPKLLELWKVVNDCPERPEEFTQRIHSIPGYDSLRHAFKKAFGQAPTHLLHELKIHRAKHLLLETRLSIKEIAARLGYQRQHEFGRAFRRRVGMNPTAWRKNPTAVAPSSRADTSLHQSSAIPDAETGFPPMHQLFPWRLNP